MSAVQHQKVKSDFLLHEDDLNILLVPATYPLWLEWELWSMTS